MGLFNESNQGRFNQFIARLHDIKGNPAPQVEPEIGHNVQIAATNIDHSLDATIGVRNCFAAITAPAIAAVSAGVRIQPGKDTVCVITGVQVNKATAGFVSLQIDDFNAAPFGGTFAGSIAFFRDTRIGNSQTARPGFKATTRLTGGLPASIVIKRVQVAAGIYTSIPLSPAVVIGPTPGAPFQGISFFGVFSETLNEALDVMIDCYERTVSPSEANLPQ